jgi:hypothetical protein
MVAALVAVLPIAAIIGFFVLAYLDYFRSGGPAATTTGCNDELNKKPPPAGLTSSRIPR